MHLSAPGGTADNDIQMTPTDTIFSDAALNDLGLAQVMNTVRTVNATGYMRNFLPEFSRRLVEAPLAGEAGILDIGGGLGNVLGALIDKGARKLTSVDVEAAHLDIQRRLLAPLLARHPDVSLTFVADALPALTALSGRQYDRIFVNQVLHYLTPDSFPVAMQTLRRLLRPDGHLLLSTGTPFIAVYAGFLDTYRARVAAGDPFPGFIEDVRRYHPNGANHNPGAFLFFTPEELARQCERFGFVPESCGYEDEAAQGAISAAVIARG